MFEFHKDKKRYFNYQYLVTKQHIIPFIEKYKPISEKSHVLEIGCAEAGVLKAFTEKNCICTGIELNKNRVALAREFMKQEVEKGLVSFITKNIYDIEPKNDLPYTFDIIILKDVIEHIPDQEKFIQKLGDFLSPQGVIFFAFPPWQMPFGGHQQICRNKFLSKFPYFHLLPAVLYKGMLKIFKEPDTVVEELLEIKKTGISIERFERITQKNKFVIQEKKLFLTNPIYQYKFNIKTRQQLPFIKTLPYLRNWFTTAVYYLIQED